MKQEEAQGVDQREPRPGSKLASMQIKKRLRTHLKAGQAGNNETHTGDAISTTAPLGRFCGRHAQDDLITSGSLSSPRFGARPCVCSRGWRPQLNFRLERERTWVQARRVFCYGLKNRRHRPAFTHRLASWCNLAGRRGAGCPQHNDETGRCSSAS